MGLFTAAYVIDSIWYALIVFAFISIVKETQPSKLVVVLAAIVVLVHPQLNEYRTSVIRDSGFWALSLIALWQYLLYARIGSVKFAAGFCGALLIATTLRPEALFYLAAAPFALLFDPRFERDESQRRFLTLAGLVTTIGLLVIIGLMMSGVNVFVLLIEFVPRYKPFLLNTLSPEPAQAAAMGNILFGEYAAAYSKEYISVFMAAGLFTILLTKIYNGVSGPFILILIYGIVQKQMRMTRAVALPLLIFILINGLVLFAFLFITRFLSGRYAILLSLMLTLFVPQIIAYYLQNKTESKRRMAAILVGIFLAYCAVDSYVSFGDYKVYVYDAAAWLQNNEDPAANLLTNNNAIGYYSGKVTKYDEITRNLTSEEIMQTEVGDLIAVEMTYTMRQLLVTPDIAARLEPIIAFPNDDDQRVVIFRRTIR